MNREEFKQTIINQVKHPKSAFNALMTRSASTPKSSSLESRRFRASEFGIDFIVESIQEGDKTSYQVLFIEEGVMPLGKPREIMDLSKARQWEYYTYAHESVNVGQNCLLFKLVFYKFIVEDYVVKMVEREAFAREVSFNAVKGSFSNKTKCKELIENIKSIRTRPNVLYHDHEIRTKDIAAIDDMVKLGNVSPEVGEKIRKAFLLSINNFRISPILQILNHLNT